MRSSDLFDEGNAQFPLRDWVCCLACERVYRKEAWENTGHLCCPNPDCDGTALDAIPWESLRSSQPHLPEEPTDGKRYSLQGVPRSDRDCVASSRRTPRNP